MSLGPITIFDKSTLQALNPDEACWFGHFYRANITPLFFVETLADIEKAVACGRTPEQVVGSLAYKTPSWGAFPNVNHMTLCIGDLIGAPVTMRGVPVTPPGRQVMTGDQRGVILHEAPEMEALKRWQRREFLDVERQFARGWRRMLSAIDLSELRRHLQMPRVRDLVEARSMTGELIRRRGRYRTLKNALMMLGVPPEIHPQILARWKRLGGPPFAEFAPYAAHVLSVDLFSYLALGSGLIAERASNRVDLAYLYYSPFCMVFVSNDHLHERVAPLFLGDDQVFIRGSELKTDLARLDAHYAELPEDVREQGIVHFAPNPPREGVYLTSQLWDRFLPRWRDGASEVVRSAETDRRIIERVSRLKREARAAESSERIDVQDADFVLVETSAPLRMGKWKLFPPEVERSQSKLNAQAPRG